MNATVPQHHESLLHHRSSTTTSLSQSNLLQRPNSSSHNHHQHHHHLHHQHHHADSHPLPLSRTSSAPDAVHLPSAQDSTPLVSSAESLPSYSSVSSTDGSASSSSASHNIDLPSDKGHSVSRPRSQLDAHATRVLALFREILQLQSYVSLNYLGFGKILKKYEKNTGEVCRSQYIEKLDNAPFRTRANEVDTLISRIEALYIRIAVAREQDINSTMALLNNVRKDVEAPQDTEEDQSPFKPVWVCIAVVAAVVVGLLPIFPNEDGARKCLSLLTFVTTLWITEAVPFFVASLSIPFLAIMLGILTDPATGLPLHADKAAKAAFSNMFSDTTMLILGGFAISAAFSKCQFELLLAAIIQRRFGRHPRIFLLAFMFLGTFLSMLISNVAAPVLLTALILPIVRDFSRSSAYARTLLLGLAIACNIGGMMSPISSPQNSIALGYLEEKYPETPISFGSWLCVSLPTGILAVFLSWLYLVLVTLRDPQDVPLNIPTIMYEKTSLKLFHVAVILTSLLSIGLWCSLTYTSHIFGQMGTIAVIPMLVFFGTGILTKNDLLGFSWHLILLVGGGSVLGTAVNNSRLLHIITQDVQPLLDGNSEWVTAIAILTMVFVISTFVSHTVCSLIMTPLVVSIGHNLGHVQVMVMVATLMMSGTMSLPMSSFPNINSLLVDDDFGRPFVHPTDYLRHGTPVALITFLLIATVGYLCAIAVFG